MYNIKKILDYLKIDRKIKRHIKRSKKANYNEFCSMDQIKTSPVYATLEISNICNLNCEMCGTQGQTRPKKEMNFEIFKKTVDELNALGIKTIRTYTINEPFVNKNIIEILEYLNEKNMSAYFSTNGMLVDKFIEKVKNTNLRNFEIKFSIDAAKKETYEKIRRGANFDKVIDNLKLTYDYKQKYHNDLKIGLGYCISNDTIDEIPLFLDSYAKYFDKESVDVAFLTEHELYKENKFKESRLNYKVYQNIPCVHFQSNNLIINNEGSFSICCVDYNAEMTYGNINEETINEAWHNEEITRLREANFNKDITNLPKPCQNCKITAQFHGYVLNLIIQLALNNKIQTKYVPYYIKEFVKKYDPKIDSLYGLPKI